MINILSYGGGLNSSALLVYLVQEKRPLDAIVFSDPGEEKKETYGAVEYFKQFSEKNGVPFHILKNHMVGGREWASILDYYEERKIIPSLLKRDCTSKFKVAPIRRFLQTKWPGEKFKMYIGIDWGEATRCRTSDVQYIKNEYPLVDARIDRVGCAELLKRKGHPIPIKSGCRFCIFNKKREIDALAQDDPEYFDRLIQYEESTHRFPEISLWRVPARAFKEKWRGQTKLFRKKEVTCPVHGGCFL